MTLALVLTLPLAGAPKAYEEERYSTFADATGFHTQAKMARAADGTLAYTYVAAVAGPEETEIVVVQDGKELPRVKAARGGQSRPSLALDAAGTLHLAWTERADEDREVFAARLAEGAWTGVTQLSGGKGYAGFPSLGASPDGSVHVAWYGFDGTHYQTFHRAWRDDAWAPATQLSAGPLDANNPSLVVDAHGGVHVAWYKDEGRRYSVWYAHRTPEGAWDVPRRQRGAGGDALNVAIAVDARGGIHLVWDERTQNGTYVQHARLDGTPETLGEGEYAAIAPWRDGVLVAWAAPDGALVGTDLSRAPAPLLGGASARHPALRGPEPLDLLFAQPGEVAHEVRHVAVHAGCSPWDAGPCAPKAATPAGGLALLVGGLLLAWRATRLR